MPEAACYKTYYDVYEVPTKNCDGSGFSCYLERIFYFE